MLQIFQAISESVYWNFWLRHFCAASCNNDGTLEKLGSSIMWDIFIRKGFPSNSSFSNCWNRASSVNSIWLFRAERIFIELGRFVGKRSTWFPSRFKKLSFRARQNTSGSFWSLLKLLKECLFDNFTNIVNFSETSKCILSWYPISLKFWIKDNLLFLVEN